MRKVLPYCFLFFFAAMSLQQISVLGVYILSQDIITEKFCINKDKPELACKGKCHMKNMMAEQNEKKDTEYNIELIVAMYFQDCVQEMPILLESDRKVFSYVKVLLSSYENKQLYPPWS